MLHSVLLELTSRLRVIEHAIALAEERREAIVRLVRRLEAAEADQHVLKKLRLRRLRAMNSVLERLCVLRQSRADLTNLWRDFTRALCETQSDGENARLRENLLGRARKVAAAAGDAANDDGTVDIRDKIPLVAARLASIGAVLGRSVLKPLILSCDSYCLSMVFLSHRLRPLSDLEKEFDVEGWRKKKRRSGSSNVDRAEAEEKEEEGPSVRLCLDLSSPLYEKVVCRVPFVALDRDGRRVDDDEGGLLLSNLW